MKSLVLLLLLSALSASAAPICSSDLCARDSLVTCTPGPDGSLTCSTTAAANPLQICFSQIVITPDLEELTGPRPAVCYDAPSVVIKPVG